MFYYDEDGDLATSRDADVRSRNHALTVLRSSEYGLAPDVAGQLDDVLGRIDPEVSKEQARRKVRRALSAAGLSEVDFEVSVDPVQKQWRLNLKVGSAPST
jgi:hypothetical protein